MTESGAPNGTGRLPPGPVASGAATREDWRRAVHAASAGLGPPALHLPGDKGTFVLTALGVAAVLLETARLTVPALRRSIDAVAHDLFRPSEERRVSGPTMLALGYLATWWLFEARVAAAAIVVGGLADPAAALVGRRWGRGAHKSLAGSAACGVVAIAALLLSGRPVVAALIGGTVAAVAERAPWRGADNLLVPLAVGAALTVWGFR